MSISVPYCILSTPNTSASTTAGCMCGRVATGQVMRGSAAAGARDVWLPRGDREMPRSASWITTGAELFTKMLTGFTSRCSTSLACRKRSPSNNCPKTSLTSATPFGTHSPSVPCPHHSETMYTSWSPREASNRGLGKVSSKPATWGWRPALRWRKCNSRSKRIFWVQYWGGSTATFLTQTGVPLGVTARAIWDKHGPTDTTAKFVYPSGKQNTLPSTTCWTYR
mmetsp:Transcript_31946/g.69940  ORF Transcript_31946/g.69940 Transcript_31946/m.69940 type:complete len:224 (+) Transcript_31946:256-927(+)